MRKNTKILNLKNANIMVENYYLNTVKNINENNTLIHGKQKINYKRTKDDYGDDILLVNHFTKKYIIDNNIEGLTEINFTHPDKDVNPNDYNWVLKIKTNEVEEFLKNI